MDRYWFSFLIGCLCIHYHQICHWYTSVFAYLFLFDQSFWSIRTKLTKNAFLIPTHLCINHFAFIIVDTISILNHFRIFFSWLELRPCWKYRNLRDHNLARPSYHFHRILWPSILSGAAVVCSLDRCQLLTTLSDHQMQQDYFLVQDLHRDNRHFYYLGLFRYFNW